VSQMYRLLPVVVALLLLLPDIRIHNAFAAATAGHSKHTANVHAAARHASSSHHRVKSPDRGTGSYRSQLQQSKSDWRQARHGGNQP
jgi:hypothetical protein